MNAKLRLSHKTLNTCTQSFRWWCRSQQLYIATHPVSQFCLLLLHVPLTLLQHSLRHRQLSLCCCVTIEVMPGNTMAAQ